jgi:outer membrane protein assembly factor BamE (lipoprotein component of BamABCDE complex)
MQTLELSLRNAAALVAAAAASLAVTLPAHAASLDAMPKWSILVTAPQKVNETAIQRIQPGQSESDVKALIGEPSRKIHFARTHTTSFDYDYRDAWGYNAVFSVVLRDDSDTVESKFSSRRTY